MATTLDFSTAIPLEEPKKGGGGVQLDFASAVPLPGVSKPKTAMEEAGDVAAAALTGAKSYPGFKKASAVVGTALRNPLDILKAVFTPDNTKTHQEAKAAVDAQYDERASKQKGIIENIDKNAPMTATGSEIAAQIPLYLSGEGALTKLFPALKAAAGAGKLNNIASTVGRGGIVNTGVQQAVAPDASRISQDFALGGAGELVGAGAGKLADKVMPAAKSVGSRLYDAVLKRGVPTMRDELEKDAGTLGQQMYDRGVFGRLKALLTGADDTIKEKGVERATHFERYNTPKDVEFPKGATYVDSPTQASTDDILAGLDEALSSQSDNAITETGYPERVIKRRPKSVSTAMRPDDVVTRTSEAPLGRGTPEEIAAKNRAEIRGSELEGAKPTVVRENFAEGSSPAPISKAKEITELEELRKRALNRPSEQHLVPQIDERIAKLKAGEEEYNIFQAETAKEDINSKLADAYMKDNNPISKEVDLAKARGLKEGIEAPFETPEGANPVRDLNKEMSYQIKLRDALKEKQARTQQNLPSAVNADLSRPIDAIRKLLGLDTVLGASTTAQGIKQGARGLEGLLKGVSKGSKVAPLAAEEISRMEEPESKYNIPIESAGNVAESQPTFRAQPGIDPSSLSPELAQELQAIIEQTGVNPFLSSSGRTAKHNAEVGGVANSKHIFNNGLSDAADFSLKNLSRADLAKFMQAARSNPKLKALIHDAGSGMHIHTERR